MKISVDCGKTQTIVSCVISLLCLVTACSIALTAGRQDSNGFNSPQPPPSIDNDLRRLSAGPVQLGPAAGSNWTSLGSYNFQTQTLSPDWRPP